jgi:hypothetical protein
MNILFVFIFVLTSDFGAPRIEDYPHSRIDAEVIHQEARSAALVELCSCFAEQRIDGEVKIELFNL